MNYPSDWPCICGHRQDEHAPAQICIAQDSKNGWGKGKWADHCSFFTPVDNLTYVEKLADARAASL